LGVHFIYKKDDFPKVSKFFCIIYHFLLALQKYKENVNVKTFLLMTTWPAVSLSLGKKNLKNKDALFSQSQLKEVPLFFLFFDQEID